MFIEFINPPPALLASGTKEGVELGGNRVILSIDGDHNFYSEGIIYTEMSWGEFFDIEGIESEIDTFTLKEYDSVREDSDALIETITESLRAIMHSGRIFYGIADFECDAFMNLNTVIRGLKLDPELINKLMDSHKQNRDEDVFPKLIQNKNGVNSIKISFQGNNKNNIHFSGLSLEDYAEKLQVAKGFGAGIVTTSKRAAIFFLMNDNIVFEEDITPEFFVDKDSISFITAGIERIDTSGRLFPVTWFRVDIGIRSLETLELWNEIKDSPVPQAILAFYEEYITKLVVNKYQHEESNEIDITGKDFDDLSPLDKIKALRKAVDSIKDVTDKYKDYPLKR